MEGIERLNELRAQYYIDQAQWIPLVLVFSTSQLIGALSTLESLLLTPKLLTEKNEENIVLKVIIRDYKENDWPEVENIILNAKNFGPPFLEDEKRRINSLYFR